MRNRRWAAPVLAVAPVVAAAAVLSACGSSSPSGAGSAGSGATTTPQSHSSMPVSNASSTSISTRHTNIGTVLVNSKGRTLYWFAIDTPTKSNCTGSCLTYWPPVHGKVTAAPGTNLPKKFGTIKGPDGQVQATYAGHPLYTYVADSAPGQTGGNGKNLSGGLWWAMTPTGAKLGAPAGAPAGGGGY